MIVPPTAEPTLWVLQRAIGFGAEITRSLLLGHIFTKCTSFVGDFVIGRHVNIGAFSPPPARASTPDQ
ncbi:hypothetical protein ACWDRR_06060 [Kitasatospora sp. NPDC003701]